MPFKEASMQHPTSCGQNILDTQVNGPYTASNEKQVLINKIPTCGFISRNAVRQPITNSRLRNSIK